MENCRAYVDVFWLLIQQRVEEVGGEVAIFIDSYLTYQTRILTNFDWQEIHILVHLEIIGSLFNFEPANAHRPTQGCNGPKPPVVRCCQYSRCNWWFHIRGNRPCSYFPLTHSTTCSRSPLFSPFHMHRLDSSPNMHGIRGSPHTPTRRTLMAALS